MAGRMIDVVAAGPASDDLYDPAAPAWALAAGLAAHGHSVRVTFPGPSEPATAVPAGVEAVPFPAVTAHVGTPLGDAELARTAARHLRPHAQVVVRDPSGLGALGHHTGHRPVVAFVRSLAGDDVPAPAGKAPRFASKLFALGPHRGIRRLEKEALAEATMVCCTTSAQRDRLRSDYGIPSSRLRVVPPAVRLGSELPTREAARRTLTVPDDVPLVAVLPPTDPAATAPAVAPAVEAYRRTRPIFTGARLVVLGTAEPYGPGITSLAARDAATIATGVAAADVVVATGDGGALDPGLVYALRAGAAVVVGPTIDLGEGASGTVRSSPLTDAGEVASVLAELVADPEARRRLGDQARAFARRFDPVELAQDLESAGALGAA